MIHRNDLPAMELERLYAAALEHDAFALADEGVDEIQTALPWID